LRIDKAAIGGLGCGVATRVSRPGLQDAQALARGGDVPGAIALLRRVTAADPADAAAFRTLAELLRLQGDDTGADRAEAEALRAATADPVLVAAASALVKGELPVAERLLKDRLKACLLYTSPSPRDH
jgi:predicted Zn-dependent protease